MFWAVYSFIRITPVERWRDTPKVRSWIWTRNVAVHGWNLNPDIHFCENAKAGDSMMMSHSYGEKEQSFSCS